MQRFLTEIGPVYINIENGKAAILKLARSPRLKEAVRKLPKSGSRNLYGCVSPENIKRRLKACGCQKQGFWTASAGKFWLYEDILNLTPLLETGSVFEKKVWSHLRKIPYGRTTTYKNIAIALKMPRAYRAVGNACKANPIPLVIPCHRVLKQNGKIGGYSSGVKWKKFLLQLERSRMEKVNLV